MYSYMIGKVTLQESVYITLEVNNIGYKIYVANPYSYMIDEEVKAYLYQQIKEDEHSLFGFRSIDERELFLKLISVKGVGPKIALPMFATGSINGIVDAIERENVLYLTKFPKIGERVAKQIILDLKGKLGVVSTDILVNVSGKGNGIPNSTALSTHTESGVVVNNSGKALFFKKSVILKNF